jgi:hypothetical protein
MLSIFTPGVRLSLTILLSQRTLASRCSNARGSLRDDMTDSEHFWPALTHSEQLGRVRLHFFLNLRQRSQERGSRAARVEPGQDASGVAGGSEHSAEGDVCESGPLELSERAWRRKR